MDIKTSYIPATPRNRFLKNYSYANIMGSSGSNNSGGGIVSGDYVKLSGETVQIVEGRLGAYQDVIAYYSTDYDAEFPIATNNTTGVIKVGNGLQVADDGTLSVTGGSGGGGLSNVTISGSGNAFTNAELTNSGATLNLIKGSVFTVNSDFVSHTANTTLHISSSERTNWNNAYNSAHTHSNMSVLSGITSSKVSNWDKAYSSGHSHNNKTYLDNINQNLSTTSDVQFKKINSSDYIVAAKDVIAYSATTADVSPIATNNLLGFVKPSTTGLTITTAGTLSVKTATTSQLGGIIVGSGLSITSAGVLSATGGGTGGTSLSLSTGGTGNAFTSASLTNNTLTLTKGTTFATNAALTGHTANTTAHITSTERTTWNNKQNALTAGSGIGISNNTISVTGSTVANVPIETLYYYRNNNAAATTKYTSGASIRCGRYDFPSGETIAANGWYNVWCWNLNTTNCLTITANLSTTSGYTANLRRIFVNVSREVAQNIWVITLCNTANETLSLAGLSVDYIAIMNGT
ncbi:hypothetical protein LJC54_00140 [Parabacteroides sp. OttesenSCG-928-J18]|nr:hypothetical protein [Parabacteroides sp. OttesenSCG-928-J18]